MSDTLLDVVHVGKRYTTYASNLQRFANWFGAGIKPSGEFWAVSDISFQVRRGESVALIGQNGAGKSSLLKLITGTVRPSTGSVAVAGSISAILELGLGFNPEFTGRENAFHAGGLMGISQPELATLMPEIESFAEIGEFFDQPFRVYSSGMQARLAFALATARRPDLLIVDEVLSVGDARFQAKCFDRLEEFRGLGTSLLLVTHSTSDVLRHCDRAVFLRMGRAAFDGEPRHACNLYLDELFGGDQPDLPETSARLSELSNNEDQFHIHPNYRKEEYRWGEGGARIIDYGMICEGKSYPHSVRANTEVSFRFSVVFENDYDSVVAGFIVKTHDGAYVYGTNTMIDENPMYLSVKAGEVYEFSCMLPMRVAAGHYLASFGISEGKDQDLKPLDRRYDSVIFSVERQDGVTGLVDLGGKFSVIEKS
ncbi:putative ATP-binding protein, ABC-type polysaccharide/polyol transporter [Aurantimonas manganoxydans SI85-9A1]|uniref:Putative ATP-binding protein, ABC-type polysaccharide/polyol transporter n=1 Tax=Aurantimonas manganoxydans (strain ATCC BAA-1229 / DSM 21871 / SI85-9A1) TaxID=287752 RepID=Q1YMB4_AURMS|nr:ABC transporter ATP-binding protein [Aurantimonas manganoxydans]EAS51467.1 putative ATP-binding protein, ABC-type polysaccharide/polyol transporter [Aurantimonas manganoxydans SI85-9A1]